MTASWGVQVCGVHRLVGRGKRGQSAGSRQEGWCACATGGSVFESRAVGLQGSEFRVQDLGARAWVAPAPVVADWRPAEISRCSIAGAGRGFSVRGRAIRLQVQMGCKNIATSVKVSMWPSWFRGSVLKVERKKGAKNTQRGGNLEPCFSLQGKAWPQDPGTTARSQARV